MPMREFVSKTFDVGDPDLFADDDGRVYLRLYPALRSWPVPNVFQHLDRFQDLGIAVQFVEH